MNHEFNFKSGVNLLLNSHDSFLQIKTTSTFIIADGLTISEKKPNKNTLYLTIKISSTSFLYAIKSAKDEQIEFQKWLNEIGGNDEQ